MRAIVERVRFVEWVERVGDGATCLVPIFERANGERYLSRVGVPVVPVLRVSEPDHAQHR
jgi:hypothetical protein